jgi:putative uncharacterized protein (fragment)
MQSQKSHSFRLFLWENIFLVSAGFCLAFLGLNFNSHQASALFVPTLSVSISNSAVSVNGNEIINSSNKTKEIPLSLAVNTNNRTGYTVILSAETDETALVNTGSASAAKINSINANLPLNNLPNNTWGYKFGTSTNYAPIPALSSPVRILQTAGKTNGSELNQIKIGMKLADNLVSGNYTNRLILSFVSNPYQMRAMMMKGPDFNTRVGNLDPNPAYYHGPGSMLTKPSIKAFKRSIVAPVSTISTINVEDPNLSDYEIKAWYNAADQSVYYYSPESRTYLNPNSVAMFQWFTKMETIDLSGFDTSEVTSMNTMFYTMSSLKNIDVSGFNTTNVTDMYAMFDQTGVIEELNVSNFDTSKVTNMGYMFFSLAKVRELDLTNFDTRNVTNMFGMFEYMTAVSKIKFSTKFDTSNATNMGEMFSNARSLQQLDLSHFNTKKIKNMTSMFSQMSALKTLDISNFETPSLENAGSMFAIDPGFSDNLERIYVNQDFDISKLVTAQNAFVGRYKLRGGNGSYLSNPATADLSWLRVDRPGVQGYFTRKS